MKITKIKIAENHWAEVKGSDAKDCCLYIFRTPVMLTIGGIERMFPKLTAIIYDEGISRIFRSFGSTVLKYDMVQFSASSVDKQYLNGLQFPLNKPISIDDDFIISSTIKNLDYHFNTSGKHKSELCELYMRIIFIALEEAYSGDRGEISEIPRFPQLKEIRCEMYDNPQRRMSIDNLCKRLAVSRTYFHRIYLSAFGVSFRQDEIKSRLTYACKLLTETEASVSVIAEKCGYDT